MISKDYQKENPFYYLSDLERVAIVRFLQDETMREAVRKVLLNGLNRQGVLKPGVAADPMYNWAMSFGHQEKGVSDEELGQNLRAYAWGLNSIESAFKKMTEVEIPTAETQENKPNPAVAPTKPGRKNKAI